LEEPYATLLVILLPTKSEWQLRLSRSLPALLVRRAWWLLTALKRGLCMLV
jgi:hypothetical protein